ncbi:MAG: TetR/AcrR family transcriptional regulator [Microbacterium sp.]|nr:MAG: TetR/AcrR family transcriptional regulator [Microbacterium sp.]PZU37508.1 MAG: TetR/AcrR family transcriptional regulator [Microbacterium sp.]
MTRTRSFDEEALLDAAIDLFWVEGYRGASLSVLSQSSGVANGSIYQAYGSKRDLFLLAFHRYCARRVAIVDQVVTERTHPSVEDIARALLSAIVDDCVRHPDRRGCLMLNMMGELGTDADVARIGLETIEAMEAAVAHALRETTSRAVSDSEISASAATLVGLAQTLIQLHRLGRDTADLQPIVELAAATAGAHLRAA